jgi:hypothetical protein
MRNVKLRIAVQYLLVDQATLFVYTYQHRRRKDFIYICGSMSSLELEMEQVCQAEETVTAETVKLAWEQVKEKVGIWEENVTQIEKGTREEKCVEEEISLVAKEENGDCYRGGAGVFAIFLVPCLIAGNVISAVMDMYVLNQSSDSPIIIRTLVIIRLIVVLINPAVSIIGCVSLCDNLYSDPNGSTPDTCKLIPGTWLPSIFLLLLATLSYASSLIIAIILHSYGYEGYAYGISIIFSVTGLASYGLALMITIYSYYWKQYETKTVPLTAVKVNTTRSTAKEMANAIKRAATVTRGWAATKSADLQKRLVANDTSRVDLKTVLAAAPKIEAVTQIRDKAQTMCQAALNSQNPSIAAKQATEILQAIPTIEGLLLEVEGMLSQLSYLPDIQVE